MIYTLPTENVADDVTPVLSIATPDAENPLANLTNSDPAKGFKSTTTTGARFVWDFGSAQRVDYVSLPMHGIPPTSAVKFQMNATDSWGSPSVDGDLTIPAFQGDFPVSQALDVTGVAGYLVGGFQFASLFVPNIGVITEIGEFSIWSQKRELTNSFRYGIRFPTQRKMTQHERRDGGRFEYDHQLLLRAVVGSFRHDSTDYDKMKALQRATWGQRRNFIVNPAATEEHLYVWWPEGFDPQLSTLGARDIGVEWVEVGRGQPL